MKILITGNTSIVGKSLIKKLKEKNHTLYTLGRNSQADIYMDLSSDENWNNIDNQEFDLIIHCAASLGMDSVNNVKTNVLGSLKVIDIAIKSKCKKIIYISTIFTCDELENEYYNSYGISKKFAGEYLSFLCKENDIAYLELLPSQLYDDKGLQIKHQQMFYFIISQASKANEIVLYGNRDVLRNYLFLEDFINIISNCIEKNVRGKYFCCHPKSYKLSEVVKIAYEVFKKPLKYKFDKTKDNIKSVYLPKNNELYELIGYYPKVDLREGIELIKKKLY